MGRSHFPRATAPTLHCYYTTPISPHHTDFSSMNEPLPDMLELGPRLTD
jgi:hypothetical protein